MINKQKYQVVAANISFHVIIHQVGEKKKKCRRDGLIVTRLADALNPLFVSWLMTAFMNEHIHLPPFFLSNISTYLIAFKSDSFFCLEKIKYSF